MRYVKKSEAGKRAALFFMFAHFLFWLSVRFVQRGDHISFEPASSLDN